jgi:hypothetical protein
MKKLLIIVFLLPMAGFGQTIIKLTRLPRLGIDSATNLRTLWVTSPVEGTKKDKLAAVLNKWFESNYTPTTDASAATGVGALTINGDGLFIGTISLARPQYDIQSSDRVATNMEAVQYKVRFAIKVLVSDEKYEIVANKFNLEFFNINSPIEPFYNNDRPMVIVPSANRGMDLGELYVRMFEDINLNLQDIAKSASKYVAKAKKKGEI